MCAPVSRQSSAQPATPARRFFTPPLTAVPPTKLWHSKLASKAVERVCGVYFNPTALQRFWCNQFVIIITKTTIRDVEMIAVTHSTLATLIPRPVNMTLLVFISIAKVLHDRDVRGWVVGPCRVQFPSRPHSPV
jgi:hypothetical protein